MSDRGADTTAVRASRAIVWLRSLGMYLVFVGIPLIGLLWVVREGRAIEPPQHIGGAWQVADTDAALCFGASSFELGQSGRYVQITVGSAQAQARLDDAHVRGTIAPSAGPCRGHGATFQASVSNGELAGTIRSARCAPCAERAFRATRSTPPPRGE